MEFKEFFKSVINNFEQHLLLMGNGLTKDNDVICHSKKFAKAFLTYSLLEQANLIKDKLVCDDRSTKKEIFWTFNKQNGYVFASEKMIEEEFNKLETNFVILNKNKTTKSINPALKKHFSVMFRELSRCYPSRIIFIGTNVGINDYEIYARQQFLEGKPIDVRRLRKIKEREGISDKKSGLDSEQE